MIKKVLILGFFLWLNTLNVFAVTSTTKQAITNNLAKSLPAIKIDNIKDTPVSSIYEITSAHKIFYVDGSGHYAFIGNMINLDTKDNLTQIAMENVSVIDWGSLPLKIAIRHIIGNGKSKIAVFTDPDCPFCQRLEQETVPNLKDVTIYYYLYPLSIHESAKSDAQKILCAENPEKVYLDWMVDNKKLPDKIKCNNADTLLTIQQLADKFGISETPTIILPNGKIITGLVPADYLNQLITNSKIIESK